MLEVRAGIDEIDERLIALLARRFGYAVASSRIKQSRAAVRDEERIAKVLANATALGTRLGVPLDIVEPVWRATIESFVAREQAMFDARAAQDSGNNVGIRSTEHFCRWPCRLASASRPRRCTFPWPT
jgi:isochorismate pyruvate lyase